MINTFIHTYKFLQILFPSLLSDSLALLIFLLILAVSEEFLAYNIGLISGRQSLLDLKGYLILCSASVGLGKNCYKKVLFAMHYNNLNDLIFRPVFRGPGQTRFWWLHVNSSAKLQHNCSDDRCQEH